MATYNETETIRLLRVRCARLESTLHAYDAMLNTPLADALRKRNAELERALWGVVQGNSLPAPEQDRLRVILGAKVSQKY